MQLLKCVTCLYLVTKYIFTWVHGKPPTVIQWCKGILSVADGEKRLFNEYLVVKIIKP